MEIVNFKTAESNETHIAEFSIHIPVWEVTFHKFKVRRSKHGHLFIAGPSFFEKDSDKDQKWCSFIEFSKVKKEAFDKKVMELVVPFLDNASLS